MISSAPLLFVVKNLAPFFIKGSYKFWIFLKIFLLFEPITILSGNLKSLIASPSLKNSGFEITSNNFLLDFFKIIFSTISPVVIGTVDLFIIILNLFMFLLICLATSNTCFKFAELLFFETGVPTQIKIISDFFTALDKLVVNFNLPAIKFLLISSFNPGSYMGICFLLSMLILFLFLSTQTTLLPKSAKQAPLTNPT